MALLHSCTVFYVVKGIISSHQFSIDIFKTFLNNELHKIFTSNYQQWQQFSDHISLTHWRFFVSSLKHSNYIAALRT